MVKNIFHILFLMIICMMIFPAFQSIFKPINSRSLDGGIIKNPVAVFSWKSWFKREYQDQYILHYEDSIGLKPELVRLFNEIDYSLFSIPHASYIVAGKNRNLYGYHYLLACLGDNFIGKRFIEQRMWQLKRLQDILWKEKKIFLLVLYAPDKGSVYPEDWPLRYKKRDTLNPSNHDWYVKKSAQYGLNYIDYTNYFIRLRDTTRYPLIPKMGTHWTSWGVWLAADTMVRYIEQKTRWRLNRLHLDSIHLSTDYRYHDDEIIRTMNLLFPRKYEVMPYPFYHVVPDSSAMKPRVLFIGDSFYRHFQEEKYIENLFSNDDFYDYFKNVYPESNTTPTTTDQIDLKKAIEKQNIIVIIQVNGGQGRMGYEFADLAYDLYDTTVLNPYLRIRNNIRKSPEYMELETQKAQKNQVDVDKVIRNDAIYLVEQELFKNSKKKY